MAAENLDSKGVCKHYRGTCFLFNAKPYEYSRVDLDCICREIHDKGIGDENMVWEMYSSSSGLSCFTVLLPISTSSRRQRQTREETIEKMKKQLELERSSCSIEKVISDDHELKIHSKLRCFESSIPTQSSICSSEHCSSNCFPSSVVETVSSKQPHHSTYKRISKDCKCLKYNAVCMCIEKTPIDSKQKGTQSKLHQQYPPQFIHSEASSLLGLEATGSISDSFTHSIFSINPRPKKKKWKIITLGLKLDKIKKKVCPCYKVYSVDPQVWLPAGMSLGQHKCRTSRINIREVIAEYLRELEKFGKYRKIGRNCSDFAAAFINLMSTSREGHGSGAKVSGVEIMCEACHRWICKCCC